MLFKIEIEAHKKASLQIFKNWFYDDDFGRMAKLIFIDVGFLRFILRYPSENDFKNLTSQVD